MFSQNRLLQKIQAQNMRINLVKNLEDFLSSLTMSQSYKRHSTYSTLIGYNTKVRYLKRVGNRRQKVKNINLSHS